MLYEVITGLTCLNVKTGEITTFGMTDGLQADQFFWGACAKSHNGDLLFGGINGVITSYSIHYTKLYDAHLLVDKCTPFAFKI